MLTKTLCRAVLAALLVIAVLPMPAPAAPCASACADEIAVCVGTECQGLTKRPLRKCRHRCKRQLVHDCFTDLGVCGATSARPVPTGGGGATGGGW